ncbi:DUF4105 domain-containing protein [Treponema sp. UBA3813]|uniref:Lnb N-terminal periplasmic domain-containing protein n=1 Tax=Treponema sp. UBA3813 TaxID=1947715 RepID=UPI0025D9DD5A|nr:DUF4105 domain-containing protein [Treponema sp. UBA3813]
MLFLFLFLIPARIFSQSQYEDSLIQKANDLSLYKDDYWLLLGHYKRTLTGYKSLVDGEEFFLAPDGKQNPKSEMEATIRAFFSPKEDGKEHPTYVYSARYKWLCQKLEIDKSQILYDGDKDYEIVKSRIKPTAIYLVFPAAYMNDPASMFGHLFYLIESENIPHLAGLSVNYGAIATDPPSLIYAIKGLLGTYPGRYDIIPYYQQITKYSYLDMRDTWEYKLLLTDDEIDWLLRHIIEMTFTYSDYYYLNENCAYCMLFPIEVARPATKLTDKFGMIVEPIQVIQRLQKEKLLDEAQYRPSLYSKMQYEKSFLTRKQKKFIKKLCFGKADVSSLPSDGMKKEELAKLWEFSADYLKYLLSESKITQQEYQKRFLTVLSERKKISEMESLSKNIPVPDEQPQKAHGSSMLSLGGGVVDKNAYGEARFRLLTHNLMDTDSGYTPNSQIEFLSGCGRYDFSQEKFSLRYFDLANIISLPVSDTFMKKKCIQFRTGLSQNLSKDGTEDLAWRLKLTLGLSTLLTKHNQIYFFLGADTFFSPVYDYWADALAGGEIGIITSAGIWKQHLHATAYQSPVDIKHTQFSLCAEERIALHQNVALKAYYSFSGDFRQTWHEAGGSLSIYY